jgi:hypothetical protein
LLAVVAAVALAGVAGAWEQRRRTADEAATFMQAKITDLSADGDPYAALRLGLRAYRTHANASTEREVDSLYRRYVGAHHVLPDDTALPLPMGYRQPQWMEPAAALIHKISVDTRTLVTTDPQQNLTVWQRDGDRLARTALGQRATRAAISRGGRYVVYLQSGFGSGVLRGPQAACATTKAGQDHGDFVCVYDRSTGRSRLLGRLDQASILAGVSWLV